MQALKFIAIGLGVLLVLCFVTVFGVIGYRLAHPRVQTDNDYGEFTAPLPPGAKVEQVALDGDRMALHVVSGEMSEILVVDVRRGKLIGTVKLDSKGGEGTGK